VKKSFNTMHDINRIGILSSVIIFAALTGVGLRSYVQAETQTKIAEAEIRLQDQAHKAIAQISAEIQTATDYVEIKQAQDSQAQAVIFVKAMPEIKAQAPKQYNLVKYWFYQNPAGAYGLLRAEKSHGNSPKLSASDKAFAPNPTQTKEIRRYNIQPLLAETSILEPGKESFFHQNRQIRNEITLRLLTASPGYIHSRLKSTKKNHQPKRAYQIEAELKAEKL
jgi:hypothetical protein